jgi:hypothetical protein
LIVEKLSCNHLTKLLSSFRSYSGSWGICPKRANGSFKLALSMSGIGIGIIATVMLRRKCHVVALNQRGPTSEAPPFTTIAAKPDFGAAKLAFFLMDPHPNAQGRFRAR